MKMSLINENEVKLVGRKGAIGMAVLKLATFGFCMGLVMKAPPEKSTDSYFTALVTLSGLFFVTNVGEHVAKRGQKDPGAAPGGGEGGQ